MDFIKNINNSSISISYIDHSIHKIAISEISIMSKDLIVEAIYDYVSDKEHIDTIMDAIDKSFSFGFYSRLNVPDKLRGNNLGSLLLDETLNVCKENNIFLLNTVNAYGDMNKNELISFYERHGMTLIDKEGILIFSNNLPVDFTLNKSKNNSTTKKTI